MQSRQSVEHVLLRGWIAARFGAAVFFLLLALCGLLIAPDVNVVGWLPAIAIVAGCLGLIVRSWSDQQNCFLNSNGIRWHGCRGTWLVPWNEVDSIAKIGAARFRITVRNRTIRISGSRLSRKWSIAADLAEWYGPISSEDYGPRHPWFWVALSKLLFLLLVITINICLVPLFADAFNVLLRWTDSRWGLSLSDHGFIEALLGLSEALAFCWTWLDIDYVAVLLYIGLLVWSILVAGGSVASCGDCRIRWDEISGTLRNVPLLFGIKAMGILVVFLILGRRLK